MWRVPRRVRRAGVSALATVLLLAGAFPRLAMACDATDPIVFDDSLGCHVSFQAFSNAKPNTVSVDPTVFYQGGASIRIAVPANTDPTGNYAGGVFVTSEPRDLSAYNAFSFWVRASKAVTLGATGFGNDLTASSKYVTQLGSIAVTTSWTQVIVPIPLAARLTAEKGVFFFAVVAPSGGAMTMWVDEVRFVNSGVITNPRPALTTTTLGAFVGASVSLDSYTRTVFAVNGLDKTVTHSASYFDFVSSNPAVGSVVGSAFQSIAGGTTSLTASLGAIAATGAITVNATALPTVPAPAPGADPTVVTSLFSDAYTSVPVDSWSAAWDIANVADLTVGGNAIKGYSGVSYAGIEFTSHTIDASSMLDFLIDVWSPAGTTFRVKLVDFGPNGIYGTDDSQSELTFATSSAPPTMALGSWVTLDIPLANFTGLTSRAHIAQIILSGDMPTFFVDNLYFSRAIAGVPQQGGATFALRGATPNPAHGELSVRFTLPDAESASLSLFDVSGRRLETRRVEGAGAHAATLGAGRDLPAGLYLIELAHHGQTLSTRAVVVR